MTWERAEGGRWRTHCDSTPRSRLSISLAIAWERAEGGRWQRHWASIQRSRRSTLPGIAFEREEGGDITLTSLNLSWNELGEAEKLALCQAWGDRGGALEVDKQRIRTLTQIGGSLHWSRGTNREGRSFKYPPPKSQPAPLQFGSNSPESGQSTSVVTTFFGGGFGWCPPTAASCIACISAVLPSWLSHWRTGGWSQVDPWDYLGGVTVFGIGLAL